MIEAFQFKPTLLVAICCFFVVNSCKHYPDIPTPECIQATGDLTSIDYNPTSKTITVPLFFPQVFPSPDNPLTEEGIELGRRLFYDPILSKDSTMSCASCHKQEFAFTDNEAVSTGVDGIAGRRSSMSLANLAFTSNGVFWDKRVATLEEQALLPVEDEVELHNDWGEVTCRLSKHADYPGYFRRAFGIEDKSEITKELAAKAIAQFERSLVSADSRYDRFIRGELFLDEDTEVPGMEMFFYEDMQNVGELDASCGHCHGTMLITKLEILNNGIDEAATLQDFTDRGYGEVTSLDADNGKFATPSLRNIALTAPYMHDGRFQTLEEVIDHYDSGGKHSPNIDGRVDTLHMTPRQKANLISFLHALTDTAFVNNPAHSNPF